jgi:hypothetical protein
MIKGFEDDRGFKKLLRGITRTIAPSGVPPTGIKMRALILRAGCTSCLFYLIQFIPPGGVSFAAHFVAHLPVSFFVPC